MWNQTSFLLILWLLLSPSSQILYLRRQMKRLERTYRENLSFSTANSRVETMNPRPKASRDTGEAQKHWEKSLINTVDFMFRNQRDESEREKRKNIDKLRNVHNASCSFNNFKDASQKRSQGRTDNTRTFVKGDMEKQERGGNLLELSSNSENKDFHKSVSFLRHIIKAFKTKGDRYKAIPTSEDESEGTADAGRKYLRNRYMNMFTVMKKISTHNAEMPKKSVSKNERVFKTTVKVSSAVPQLYKYKRSLGYVRKTLAHSPMSSVLKRTYPYFRAKRQANHQNVVRDLIKTYPLVIYQKKLQFCLDSFRVHSPQKTRNSGCQGDCNLFSVCCPLWKKEKLQQYEKFVFPQNEHVTCEKLSSADEKGNVEIAEMISKCPRTMKTSQYQQFCEQSDSTNILESSPVTSRYTSITYRNKYCGLCHGEYLQYLTAWELKIFCKYIKPLDRKRTMSDAIGRLLMDADCEYIYNSSPTNSYMLNEAKCMDEGNFYVKQCLQGSDFSLVCGRHYQPAQYWNGTRLITYRNNYCAACRGAITDPESPEICNKQVPNRNRINGFQAIFDFSNFIHGETYITERYCGESEIAINDKHDCVSLHCPQDEVPYFGRCIDQGERVTTRGATLTLVLFTNGSTEQNAITKHFPKISRDIANIFKVASRYFYLLDQPIKTTTGKISGTGQLCTAFFVERRTLIPNVVKFTQLEQLLIQKESDAYFFDLNEKVDEDVYLAYNVFNKKPICESDIEFDFHLPPIQFLLSFSKLNEIPCPAIELTNEYSLGYNVRSHANNQTAAVNDTFSVGSRTFICIEALFSKYKLRRNTSEENTLPFYHFLLNSIFSSISVGSLMISILHVVIIKSFRSSQSLTLVNMMVAVMITQLAFLVVSDLTLPSHAACYWIGVFLHFLFLSMFCAMLLHAIHITIQVRKMYVTKASRHKIFGLFILPSYLLPAILVSSAVAMDNFVFTGSQWYDDKVCFLSNAEGMFYFLSIPLVLMLLCNMTCFSLMVVHLYRVKSPTEYSNSKRNNALIALRLSIIMGFSWILGIFASLIPSSVIWVCFEVACSLQGTFISIGFLSNATIKRWYQDKIALRCSAHAN